LDIVICSSTTEGSAHLEKMLVSIDDWNLVGRTQSARGLVDLMNSEHVDVGLVTSDALEIGLSARRQLVQPTEGTATWVAHLEHESVLHMVKAAQFGFDDVITGPATAQSLERDLADIVSRRRSVVTNPALSEVDLVPGLYSRIIEYRDDTDRDLCELLGLGLEDRAAAFVLHTTIQDVRNRIAALLERNGLSTRTQLATLHIRSHLSIEDGR